MAALGTIVVALLPLIPAFLLEGEGEGAAGVSTLVALVVQDSVLMGSALLFAALRLTPRRWTIRNLFRRLDRVGDAWAG